jgi:hypothetical protein
MPNEYYQQDDEGGGDKNGSGTHDRTIAGKCSFGEPVMSIEIGTGPLNRKTHLFAPHRTNIVAHLKRQSNA